MRENRGGALDSNKDMTVMERREGDDDCKHRRLCQAHVVSKYEVAND